jgi:hypothetical protein
MRPIEIDFDIHKLIEAERRSFDEPVNDALRRLLNLPERPSSEALVFETAVHRSSPLSWKAEGVELPHGTKLRMTYGRPKVTYEGVIDNGAWKFGSRVYASPSGAASGLAVTAKGKKTRLNGWEAWEVQRPGDQGWVELEGLRKQARPGLQKEAAEMLKNLGL